MSRLFEALSGLKTEHRATEVVTPLAIAPPAVDSADAQARGETGTTLAEGSSADIGSTRRGSAGARARSESVERGRAEASRDRGDLLRSW